MSTICKRISGYEAEISDDSQEHTLHYQLRGVFEDTVTPLTVEEVAENMLLAEAPLTFRGLPIIRYHLVKNSASSFTGRVTYSHQLQTPHNLLGAVITFSGTTETVQRYHAPVISSVVRAGATFTPSQLTGMNIDSNGEAQGVPVKLAKMTMSINVRLSTGLITFADILRWKNAQTLVNSVAWGAFAIGELQFSDFNYQTGDKQKDSVTFNFELAPNETIVPADFGLTGSNIVKLGHDVVSIFQRKVLNGDIISPRVEAVVVHRPNTYADLTNTFTATGTGTVNLIPLAFMTALT